MKNRTYKKAGTNHRVIGKRTYKKAKVEEVEIFEVVKVKKEKKKKSNKDYY